MTFRSRHYMYGVTKEGVKEFLHTSLDVPGAVAFMRKHRKLFGDRYVAYFHKTQLDEVEHYIE